MSDPNRGADMGMWGRTGRKRTRPGTGQPAASNAAPLGPVDDAAALERAAIIIRADRPAASATPAYEVIGAPKERVNRAPDEIDFKLRDLVGYMARGLVDHPESVDVDILAAGDDGMLELSVHPDDIGHVIGKQGRTAKSLRLTLGAAAARADRRVSLEIAD